MMIGEVEDLITEMAETADILSLPEDWLIDHLISTAHMREREVMRETVVDAIEFWRQDYLKRLHWQEIERKLEAAAQQR